MSRSDPTMPSLVGGHRRDIEAMRAVAVVAVLAYHAGVPGFAGGYVGVDVFFALSGYLMTGLLATEQRRRGSIDFGAFYARRARRLLPASALVLVVTTLVSAIVLTPLALRRVTVDAAWAGFYAVNLRFAGEATDYLGADVAESPILHYWSLAVEEQFYLVWPVLLWLALLRTTSFRRPVIVLAGLSVTSFVVALWMTGDIQPWAFFGLPARAWEFGIGGLGVFAGHHVAARSVATRTFVAVSGLVLVAYAIFTYDALTRFPGPGALIPVGGTVLVLMAGARPRTEPATPPGGVVPQRTHLDRAFAAQPLQWIGARSYAMYLWHWPPLVLLPVALERELSLLESAAAVVGACVVATAAHRFVEDPIRFSKGLAPPARSGLLALGLTLTAVLVPAVVRSQVSLGGGSGEVAVLETVPITEPDEPRPAPSNLTPSIAEVGDDRPVAAADGCHVGQRAEEPKLPCAYGAVGAGRTMVLFGDSHMVQWYPAFEQFGLDEGWRVVVLTKSGCPSLSVTVYNDNFGRDYTECDVWRERTLEVIADMRPGVVVLGNYPRSPADDASDDEVAEWNAEWVDGLASTVSALAPAVGQVVVLGPTPIPSSSIPECVSGHLDDTRSCDLVRRERAPESERERQRQAAIELGAEFVDVTDWLCGEDMCPSVIGPILVYRDASHISTPMAAILAPELAAALGALG